VSPEKSTPTRFLARIRGGGKRRTQSPVGVIFEPCFAGNSDLFSDCAALGAGARAFFSGFTGGWRKPVRERPAIGAGNEQRNMRLRASTGGVARIALPPSPDGKEGKGESPGRIARGAATRHAGNDRPFDQTRQAKSPVNLYTEYRRSFNSCHFVFRRRAADTAGLTPGTDVASIASRPRARGTSPWTRSNTRDYCPRCQTQPSVSS